MWYCLVWLVENWVWWLLIGFYELTRMIASLIIARLSRDRKWLNSFIRFCLLHYHVWNCILSTEKPQSWYLVGFIITWQKTLLNTNCILQAHENLSKVTIPNFQPARLGTVQVETICHINQILVFMVAQVCSHVSFDLTASCFPPAAVVVNGAFLWKGLLYHI